MDDLPDQSAPIMLLGVGRSGTNLLARVLGVEPTFVNLLESRYIWTYGVHTRRHDLRTADEATPRVRRFIRRYFFRHASATGAIPIDKTPSNVYRLPFIDAVFPNAKMIHIVREGRDNVASRWHAWQGGRKITQAASKSAMHGRGLLVERRLTHLYELLTGGQIPVSRLPAAVADNVGPVLAHVVTGQPRRYGERFPGMQQTLACYGMLVASAVQWREGVSHGIAYGRRLPPGRYLELRLEDLVREPGATWQRLASFLSIDPDGRGRRALEAEADPARIGEARRVLTPAELAALEPHIRPMIEYLGYAW